MKSKFFTYCALVIPVLVLSACANGPEIGQTPDATPPQLVVSGHKDRTGQDLLIWDRPSAFGKVDGPRKVTGDAFCLLTRVDLEAVGYHPKAKDLAGKDMPGGGYFCSVKATADRPSSQPPRLQRTNGVLGWDRPAAFGAVPAADKTRGDAVCALTQAGHEAVAYHPAALDEAGKPINGGGFFCGPRRSGDRAVS